VDGLNVGWRDRPQHRIDVLAQDASHDFRMFVARLDVLREPDFTEPLEALPARAAMVLATKVRPSPTPRSTAPAASQALISRSVIGRCCLLMSHRFR
jgi:hypothetical protein